MSRVLAHFSADGPVKSLSVMQKNENYDYEYILSIQVYITGTIN